MTAQKAYERALALYDEISDDGTVDTEATASYAGKAPRLIDVLQREIATLEDVTATEVTTLTDTLVISDNAALGVLPYGLAAEFAAADGNTNRADRLQSQYEVKKRMLRHDEEDISDEYEILDGLQG